MGYILLAVILLLGACDGSSAPTSKIAEPQREALEKAMSDLRVFDLYVPVAGSKLRDRIAAQLIEKGGYPIEHF